MPDRYTDPLAAVTRAELRDELSPIREELAAIRENMHHLATNESVERMGRLMLMWTVGTMIALVSAVVALMLALQPQ